MALWCLGALVTAQLTIDNYATVGWTLDVYDLLDDQAPGPTPTPSPTTSPTIALGTGTRSVTIASPGTAVSSPRTETVTCYVDSGNYGNPCKVSFTVPSGTSLSKFTRVSLYPNSTYTASWSPSAAQDISGADMIYLAYYYAAASPPTPLVGTFTLVSPSGTATYTTPLGTTTTPFFLVGRYEQFSYTGSLTATTLSTINQIRLTIFCNTAPGSVCPAIWLSTYATSSKLKSPLLTNTLVFDQYGIQAAAPGNVLQYKVTLDNSLDAVGTGALYWVFNCPTALDIVSGQYSSTVGGTFSLTSNTLSWTSNAGLNPFASGFLYFNATVKTPPGQSQQLSCQGTLTSAFFGSFQSDDPSTVAANDPTVTPVIRPVELTATSPSVAAGNSGNLACSIFPSVSVAPLNFSCAANGFTWAGQTLAVGLSSFVVPFSVSGALAAGTYNSTCTFTQSQGNRNLLYPATFQVPVTVIQLPISSVTLTSTSSFPLILSPGNRASSFIFNTDQRAINGSISFTQNNPFLTLTPSPVLLAEATATGTVNVACSDATPPGAANFTVTLTGNAGNNNNLGAGQYTFRQFLWVTQDNFTSLTITAPVSLEAGNTGLSTFLVGNVRPVNGTLTLTPTAPFLQFVPSSVTVGTSGTTSPNFTVSALDGASAGVQTISVTVTQNAGNNNGISPTITVASGVSVYQPRVMSISTTPATISATANGTGVALNISIPIRALNGSIRVTPTATNIVFQPLFVDIPQDQFTASFTVFAQPQAVAGATPISVALASQSNNNNDLSSSPFTSNALTVTLFALSSATMPTTDIVAGVGSQTTWFALNNPVVNGSVTVTPVVDASSGVTFSPASATITPGLMISPVFTVTAASSAPRAVVPVTLVFAKASDNNNIVPANVSVTGILNVTLLAVTAISANGGSTVPIERNHPKLVAFDLNAKAINAPIDLSFAATNVEFTPSTSRVETNNVTSGWVLVNPKSNAAPGTLSTTVTLAGSAGNNNNLAASPLTDVSIRVDNSVIRVVSLNWVESVVRVNQTSGWINVVLDTVASNGAVNLALSFPGVVFTPSSITVAAEQTVSSNFTVFVTEFVDISAPLPVNVFITAGTNNNNNFLPNYTFALPVSGLPISDMSLVLGTGLLAGRSADGYYLQLDVNVLKAPLSMTLFSPYFLFTPATITFAQGGAISELFSISASPATPPGLNSISGTFSANSNNNNELPLSALTVTNLPVGQVDIASATFSTPIVIEAGGDASDPIQIVLSDTAVNGSIEVDLDGVDLIFTPVSVFVAPDSATSSNFTVRALGQRKAGSATTLMNIGGAPGEFNNNHFSVVSEGPLAIRQITVNQIPISAAMLTAGTTVYAGGSASSNLTITIDRPAINGSIVLWLVDPLNQLTFSVPYVTVAQDETVSEPFTITAGEAAEFGPRDFAVVLSAGPNNNNLLPQNVTVSGLNITYFAITSVSLAPLSLYAGGAVSGDLVFTVDVAPLYGTVVITPNHPDLLFSSNTGFPITVARDSLTSTPFTITALESAAPGVRSFTVTVTQGSPTLHSFYPADPLTISSLTVQQIAVTKVTLNAPVSIVAGSSNPPAYASFVVDVPAKNGTLRVTSGSSIVNFSAVATVPVHSTTTQLVMLSVPRSIRPTVMSVSVVVSAGPDNNNDLSRSPFTVDNVTVTDGLGPLLTVLNLSTTQRTAILTIVSDEVANVTCIAVPAGADSPALDAITQLRGKDRSGSGSVSTTPSNITVSGVPPGGNWDFYCLGQDVYGNVNTLTEVASTKRNGRTGAAGNTPGAKTIAGMSAGAFGGMIAGIIIGLIILGIIIGCLLYRFVFNKDDWSKKEAANLDMELAHKPSFLSKPAPGAAGSKTNVNNPAPATTTAAPPTL